jgi:hypothetical protein
MGYIRSTFLVLCKLYFIMIHDGSNQHYPTAANLQCWIFKKTFIQPKFFVQQNNEVLKILNYRMQYDQYAMKKARKTKYTVFTGKIEGNCQFLAASQNSPPSSTGFSPCESFCVTQSKSVLKCCLNTHTLFFYCSRILKLTHSCSWVTFTCLTLLPYKSAFCKLCPLYYPIYKSWYIWVAMT